MIDNAKAGRLQRRVMTHIHLLLSPFAYPTGKNDWVSESWKEVRHRQKHST